MAPDDPTPTEAHDHRWLIVIGLYVVAAFWGFAQALSENSLVYWLNGLLVASLATAWCVGDAWRRGSPILPVVQLIMFLLWPIAVPIYLVATRGWRGLGYALLHAIGLIAITEIFFLATAHFA